MEDPAQVPYTELPVPLLSTAALLRHRARFHPYHRLHQPQHFHRERKEDEGRTHISRLYPEILAIIFSYLEVRDKGRVAQVCAAWRDAAYRKSVWRGVEAKLHLRRANPSLFASLVRRGIKRVQVLSLKKSLRDVVQVGLAVVWWFCVLRAGLGVLIVVVGPAWLGNRSGVTIFRDRRRGENTAFFVFEILKLILLEMNE